MSAAKIVKRYANRKLYDTERSCYVTLDDIAVMIRSGEEVTVVDNKSGEDLTSVTLAQIIFETEKKSSFMPLGLLRGIIQESGESIGGFARDQVETVQKSAQEIGRTAHKLREQIGGSVGSVFRSNNSPEANTRVKDLLNNSQKTIEEMQKTIEERVQNGLGSVSDNVQREMEDIFDRLGDLRERFRR
jgi:polyhydroxyalkanoate synthesis repressor PhaR